MIWQIYLFIKLINYWVKECKVRPGKSIIFIFESAEFSKGKYKLYSINYLFNSLFFFSSS